MELKDLLNRDTAYNEIEKDIYKIGEILEKCDTISKGYVLFISDFIPTEYADIVKRLHDVLDYENFHSTYIISLNVLDILKNKNFLEWKKERNEIDTKWRRIDGRKRRI